MYKLYISVASPRNHSYFVLETIVILLPTVSLHNSPRTALELTPLCNWAEIILFWEGIILFLLAWLGVSAHNQIILAKFQSPFWSLCKAAFSLDWHLDSNVFYWILPQDRYKHRLRQRVVSLYSKGEQFWLTLSYSESLTNSVRKSADSEKIPTDKNTPE